MIDFTDIAKLKENFHIEAKKALGGVPASLWETYSAFANTDGGIILLGVSEENSVLKITGVQDVSQKIQNIWNTLNNRNKISANILTEKRIYTQKVEGKDIILINVPRADRHDKPVYINNDLFGGTFRRNAEGDYHCSRQTVKSMLRDQSDSPIDGIVIHELSWKDLDMESIARYRNRFASLKPAHVWNGLDTVEFLKKIGAIRKNEEDIFCPTLAGLVMFGTENVITQIFPDYFLDYREQYDNERWSDRVVSNLGEWSGNVFDFFFRIADKVSADIKRPFRMLNSFEREDDTAIHQAIREALANAVIHADYYGKRGIVIEKRKNEIRIANPGICRPDIKEILEGDVSDPRNPIIFKMFALIDIGERAGCGIFNLITLWKQTGWNKPILKENFDAERTTLVIPIELMKNTEKTTVEKIPETVEETVEEIPETVEKTTITVEETTITVEETVGEILETVEKATMTVEKTVEEIIMTVEETTMTMEKTIMTVEEIPETVEEISETVEEISKKTEKTADKILRLIQNNPYITQEKLIKLTGLTRRGVEWNISQLKTKKLIERIGPNKGGYWKILDNNLNSE
jgi:predicted HTH transcriptional regulator